MDAEQRAEVDAILTGDTAGPQRAAGWSRGPQPATQGGLTPDMLRTMEAMRLGR